MIFIKNARRFDNAEKINILISDGVITEINPAHIPDNTEVLDARGLTVAPGLFDMHVHLRDPGQTHKGDILTETSAAAAGGVTSVAAMPNTSPTCDSADTVSYILAKSASASAHVYPIAAVTYGLRGEKLTDFAELAAAGACGFTDDGRPIEPDDIMEQAMVAANALDLPLISHCEDMAYAAGGKVNTGAAERLKVAAMHPQAEYNMVRRDIAIAEKTGLKVHIAHCSAAESIEAIRQAKKRDVRVTCETCPHYFSLTEELTLTRDADYRMNPPLRTRNDIKAVIDGLVDGTVDAIVTDHAPHSPEEKADFMSAPNGVIGLETSLAAGITYLVKTGILTLSQLIYKMSTAPALIMSAAPVTLNPGAAADLILIDPEKEWVVDTSKLHGKSRNSVYKNMSLTGKVMLTVVGGQIKYNII